MEKESSLRNVVFSIRKRRAFLDKDRTMDNVQKPTRCSSILIVSIEGQQVF
jgi:hypothetical protein